MSTQKQKTPSSSAGGSRKKRKVEETVEEVALLEFQIPEGYVQAAQPPTKAMLEFGNKAGDALVGKHILFNWEGVGWCEGTIDKRNTDATKMIDDEDYVNFTVHYEIDDDTSDHFLDLESYGGGPEAEFSNWVLLELTPTAYEDEDGEDEKADEQGEGAKEAAAMDVDTTA